MRMSQYDFFARRRLSFAWVAAISRFPIVENGVRVWLEKLSMATDDSTHFPIVGKQFVEAGHVRSGKIGEADALLFSTRALVDFAERYFRQVLTCP
jgi:aminoglycoside 3-N-acetyltransferase